MINKIKNIIFINPANIREEKNPEPNFSNDLKVIKIGKCKIVMQVRAKNAK